MTKSIFFYGEPIPDCVIVRDQINRRFLYQNGRFLYSGRTIPPADLDWPLTLETP